MQIRPLGRSGLQTAPLDFAGKVFGWTAEKATTFKLLDAFVDGGFDLETAVGRARVGCDGVRWQGLTTRRAHARKEEQCGQRRPALLNRMPSAVTQEVKFVVAEFVSIHAVFDAGASGQLPFPGSS